MSRKPRPRSPASAETPAASAGSPRRTRSAAKGKSRGKLTALAAKLNDRVSMQAAKAPNAAPQKPAPSTRRNKKGLVLYVDPAVTVALRRLALDRGTSVQALGLAALEMLFAAHGVARFPAGEGRT
jgi:hypothetical protein